jgi:hypothetical protein
MVILIFKIKTFFLLTFIYYLLLTIYSYYLLFNIYFKKIYHENWTLFNMWKPVRFSNLMPNENLGSFH